MILKDAKRITAEATIKEPAEVGRASYSSPDEQKHPLEKVSLT